MIDMKMFVALTIMMSFAVKGYSSAPAQSDKQHTGNSVMQEQQVHKNLYDKKKRRHGIWEFYWENDTSMLANKGEFRHGNQVGTWYYYNQDGSLQKTETKTKVGKRFKTQIYYPDGKLQKEGYAKLKKDKEYLNYYWYGEWKCYDEQGNLVKTEHYKKGELVD